MVMSSGEKIRYYRKQQGLSQKALGELAGGIHEVTIRKYETGRRNPKPEQLKKIANALGISVFLLLDIDIENVSDVLALLFEMEEHPQININGVRNSRGEVDPKTISITISDSAINERIALWMKTKDVLTKMIRSKDSYATRKDYEDAISEMSAKVNGIKARLLQDTTALK